MLETNIEISGRVEVSFGGGTTIVKVGQNIFQLVGYKLKYLTTLKSSDFSQYCCNFFYFNGKHYCGDRMTGLFEIDVKNKKLIQT